MTRLALDMLFVLTVSPKAQLALCEEIQLPSGEHQKGMRYMISTVSPFNFDKTWANGRHYHGTMFTLCLACRTGILFFAFFRQARASARRTRSARHARWEGREIINKSNSMNNGWCTGVIFFAPLPVARVSHFALALARLKNAKK